MSLGVASSCKVQAQGLTPHVSGVRPSRPAAQTVQGFADAPRLLKNRHVLQLPTVIHSTHAVPWYVNLHASPGVLLSDAAPENSRRRTLQSAMSVAAPEAPQNASLAPQPTADGRSGVTESGRYYVSEEDKQIFHLLGFVHLPAVMTDEEMSQNIDGVRRQRP